MIIKVIMLIVYDLIFLKNNIINEKCFGIQEIGLDFNRNFSSKEDQIYAFTEQLNLAKELNTNVYLHCRDTFDEFISIIKQVDRYKGLVHCFTGNIKQALEITSLGFKLGIIGWLLDKKRNVDLVDVIENENITLDMLIVETDAPFMPIKSTKTTFIIRRYRFDSTKNI